MERASKYPFAEIEAKWRRIRAETESPEHSPSDGKERRRQYIYTWPASAGTSGGLEADTALWRRLLLADTNARFLSHRGQDIFLPLGIDGYTPEVEAETHRLEADSSALVEAERASLERCASVLGLQTAHSPAATTDPSYYRITQWIFLQLMARGLVYRSERTVDNCKKCGTIHRHGVFSSCPRCQGAIEAREISERRVDISAYGDRLLGDLDGSERRGGARGRHRGGWSRRERVLQRECLGRCRGCEVVFPVTRPFEMEYHDLEVFTTRVETLYGAMFILIDPYHPALELVLDPACEDDVIRYRERLKKGGEPRISAVLTGGVAINPLTLKKIPVLASVLADVPYSRGVVMGVPAHDADLFELAKRLRLPVREVIHNDKAKFDHKLRLEQPWLGDGVLTNSGPYSGLQRNVARERIVSALARKGCCRKHTRFRLSSLPISSASAWGPAVPLVHCEKCGEVPAAESELPVLSPEEAMPRQPGGKDSRGGHSRGGRQEGKRGPVVCPSCGGRATRDSESLLPWLGRASSFVRLALPHLAENLEGFRDLSAPPGQEVPAIGKGTLPAEGGAAETVGSPSDGSLENARDEDVSDRSQDVAEELFPEDVDIFSVPASSSDEEASPEDEPDESPEESGGLEPQPESESEPERESEPEPGAEPTKESAEDSPSEPDTAKPDPADGEPKDGEPKDGDPKDGDPKDGDPKDGDPKDGDPKDGEPKDGEPKDGEPKDGEPKDGDPKDGDPKDGDPKDGDPKDGDPKDGDPKDGDPAERDKKASRRGPRATAKGEAAAGKGDDAAEADDEDDDGSVQDRLLRLSSLKPFSSDALRLIPATVGFGDGAAATRDIIALRFLAKFLHDIGQVPSHMPFFRYVTVEPLMIQSAATRQDEGPPPPAARVEALTPRRDSERGHDGSSWATGDGGERLDCFRIAETSGMDALRLQVLFCGPVDRRAVLDPRGVRRMQRLLDRIWRQMELRRERGKFVSRRMLVQKHHLIYDVTQRLAELKYHTAVAALMRFLRFLEDPETTPEDMDRGAMKTFIVLLSPFAPNLAQELWSLMGHTEELHRAPWPVASDELIHPPEREILILVDSKICDRMVQPSDLEPEKLESRALQQDRIRELTGARKVLKVVVVPQKLVSIALAPASDPPS